MKTAAVVTVAVFCPRCGRQEPEREAYRQLKQCECGRTRILCSRYEWALVDALRDELGWRQQRGDVDLWHVVEQQPIVAERFDIRTREQRRFLWHFDAAVMAYMGPVKVTALVEVDGKGHYDRTISRDKQKDWDAVDQGWAKTGGLYVIRNDELRPRRTREGHDWRGAYEVAAEIVREMLGRPLPTDRARRRW